MLVAEGVDAADEDREISEDARWIQRSGLNIRSEECSYIEFPLFTSITVEIKLLTEQASTMGVSSPPAEVIEETARFSMEGFALGRPGSILIADRQGSSAVIRGIEKWARIGRTSIAFASCISQAPALT